MHCDLSGIVKALHIPAGKEYPYFHAGFRTAQYRKRVYFPDSLWSLLYTGLVYKERIEL